MVKVAQRAQISKFLALDTFIAANALEAEGRDILHLEIGQPSDPPPDQVVLQAAEALKADPQAHAYTQIMGKDDLRARVAELYGQRYGVKLDPKRVAMTMGSSAALSTAFLASFDPGDSILVPRPCYPAYRHMMKVQGLTEVDLDCGANVDFRLTAKLLEGVDQPVDGLIIGNPCNPTGTMIADEEMPRIAAWARANDVRIIADEVYHGITYERQATSFMEVSDTAIVTGGFSKYFAMTGWRLGWLVTPEDMVPVIQRLLASLFISPPTLSQHGGLAALECEQSYGAMIARYRRNRDILVDGLARAGFTHIAPADGAFYLFVDVSAKSDDSFTYANYLLHELGIATTPGADFDPIEGHRYIRMSYAGATETMEEAVRRLMADAQKAA